MNLTIHSGPGSLMLVSFVLKIAVLRMDRFNLSDGQSTNLTNTKMMMMIDNNKDVSERIILLQNVELNLWRYVTPLLFAFGFVGNVLTIFVLMR